MAEPTRPPHRKTVRFFNVPGHIHFLTFSCYRRLPLLTNDSWRAWLGESVRAACAALETALWAYVFMPEHVHLLVKPRRVHYDISRFVYRVKRPFSGRVIDSLRESSSPLLQKLKVRERPGKYCYRFWQEGPGHDKNLWSLKKAIEKARYCHRNPVVRKLVRSPEQWVWSSVRWLEMGKRDGEPLKVDDWDPRLLDEISDAKLDAYARRQWDEFCKGTWGKRIRG